MEEGHRPVLAEEVMKMLAPRPGSLHVDCTSAAVGTPSGSWRPPARTAASSG